MSDFETSDRPSPREPTVPNTTPTVRVFLASPSDTSDLRDDADSIISDLGRIFRYHFTVELIRWEKIPPNLHPSGAQGLIDEAVRYGELQILIGIYRHKFGKPFSDRHNMAPTEYEIRTAERIRQGSNTPRIMVYFPRDLTEVENGDRDNWQRFALFKSEFETKGLVRSFGDRPDLSRILRSDLQAVLDRLAEENRESRKQSGPICDVRTRTPTLRIESITELLGDIELEVTGANIGGALSHREVDIQISLNVNVTNLTESRSETDSFALTRDGVVVRGALCADNAIIFRHVPVNLRDGDMIRISQIRGNPSQGGLNPANVSSEITAYVSLKSKVPIPIYNYLPVIGVARKTSIRHRWIADSRQLEVTFSEIELGQFRTAFEEMGGSQGTRFYVRLFNLPLEAQCTAAVGATTNHGWTGRLVPNCDANGSGGLAVEGGSARDWTNIALSGGYGGMFWEWVANNSRADDPWSSEGPQPRSITFHIRFLGITESPEFEAGLAPLSTIGRANKNAPVPRFLPVGYPRTAP
jgi:hypothetical protein